MSAYASDSSDGFETLSVTSYPHAGGAALTGTLPALSARYRVDGLLGRGGAGLVYRGWDEELGRPVAIKIVRPDRSEESAVTDPCTRMRRESKALASLSHPNVVSIYDVVEGEGTLAIVMELVEGESLRAWSRAQRRPTEEILRVFVQAGRGLEAAHARGLVHRDFKPSNVVVGGDGRVRVLDFGLARGAASPDLAASGDGVLVLPRESDAEGSLTEVGTVMGTPAYMAPEQIDGADVDARSDQFSFCVSLFETLAGRRPYEALSLRERRAAMREGPPHLAAVSLRLRRLLERGLQLDPNRRFPSMDAVVAELERELEPSKRWWGVGAVVLLGVTASGALLSRDRGGTGCAASDPRRVAWTDARRSAVRGAFLGVDVPFGPSAWHSTEAALDAYVEAWAQERDEVCRATEPDEARLSCLLQVRARFDATVDVLEAADADVVENAVASVHRLPLPGECRPTRSSEDEELEELAARAEALAAGGRFEPALAASEILLEKALAAGNPAYEARGLLLAGSNRDEMGDYDGAVDRLEDAYFLALRLGDRQLAAKAALQAASAVGLGLRRVEAGRTWVRHARTQIDQLEEPQSLLATAGDVDGGILLLGGSFEEGLVEISKAYEIQRAWAGDDDIGTVTLLNNVGLAYQRLGRFDEALAHHRRARDSFTAIHGPDHPTAANADHAIAGCLVSLGRIDEAVAVYRRVIDRWSQTLGPKHPRVAMVYYNIGYAEQMAEAYEPALEYYREAIALLEHSLPPDHVNIAMAVHNVGSVLHELKRLDEAQEHLERSLAAFESTEASPLYLAINRFELAMVLHERGVDRDRVTALIEASRDGLANGAAFEQQELAGIQQWIRDNRPDLAIGGPAPLGEQPLLDTIEP